ncbi:Transposon TX1 uncharacterized protein [Glycine soja]
MGVKVTTLGASVAEFEEERDVEVKDAETLESIDNRPVSPKAEIKPMDRPKLWVDVVSDNRNPSKGLSIEYVALNVVNGKVEIEIEEDDIAIEMKFWETTLILYALGEDLSMNAMKSYMVKMWNFVKLPEMYYHDDGYFILRFNSHDGMDVVLMKGPYTIRNVPLLLKEWKPNFNLQRDMLRTLPLWVKLPKLPLHLWGVKSFNKIRCVIEVDITKTLVKEVTIKDYEGRKISQGVEYEWRPLYCEKCHKLGHQLKINEDKRDIWTRVSKPTRDKGKLREISSRLSNLKPDIMILLETRVKETKASSTREKLNLHNNYIDNYQSHANGRIWVSWDDMKLIVQQISNTDQFIHCGIYDNMGKFKYWLTAIYAQNQLEHKRVLWKDLEHLHSTIQGPWCVIGDFNNVACANDRIGGRMVIENEYIDLQEMMNIAGLSEMESIGDYFTWSNKHYVGTIYSRIDRVLGNVQWFQDRLDYHLKILPPSVLDHALLCVKGKMQPKNKTRRFKFYNCMVDMIGCEKVVQNSWNRPIRGTPMHVLRQKLQRLKPELVQLGKSMTNARQELVKARRDLDLAQNAITHNRMDDNLIDTVKKCTKRVINWNEMEGNMLRQRAKVDWLRMGDENNAFFHSIIKAKHQNRSMSILQKGDGTILTEQSDIHNEVMEFYRKLMGSTASNLRHIDIQAMRDDKQITFDQGAFLTATITEVEIVKALQGIGDLKAPGIDGYGAKFFKNSWHIVKKDFIAAMNEFFEKGTLLKINPAKRKVFCGGLNYDSIQVVKNITGFEEGTLPVKYLGVPLSCIKLNVRHYLPLVEKIVGRIRHWSSKLLGIAGRIQLVRSIITVIAQYWMSVFPMPKKDDNLWVKWIHAYFLKGNNVMSATVKSNSTWILKSIMKQRPQVNNLQQIWIEMLRKRKFSMKQVYMELVEDHNRADWFSLLRYNRARPRANVTLWLACQNRLATKTRLKNMNLIQCSLYSLCKEQDEDLDHLMFSCRVTKAIWLEVLKWILITHLKCGGMKLDGLCNIRKEKDGKGKF